MKTSLIVTIDTEEEGLWNGSFKERENTVQNINGVPAFQAVCNNLGIKPVYLVNTPVLNNDRAVTILREISEQNDCEIGTHIHPWNTPPVASGTTAHSSYLCNLPTDMQERKVAHVTQHIKERFGRTPTSFRAGRYGLDDKGVKILKDLGYRIDSSVCPFTDYSADGGPNFEGFPDSPYYLGDSLRHPTNDISSLLEVPVSFGFNWTNFYQADRIHRFTGHSLAKKFRIRGILDRAGILKKYKFSPEKHDEASLKNFAKISATKGSPVMVMMFHSSSLSAGDSPYVPDKKALIEFLNTIESVCAFCIDNLGMIPSTFEEFGINFALNKERCGQTSSESA